MSGRYRLPENPSFGAVEAERLSKAAQKAEVDVSEFAKEAILNAVERELNTGSGGEADE